MNSGKFKKNGKYWIYVSTLLIFLIIIELLSSTYKSQTVDEGVHLSAGYSYLAAQDFRMNQEHPPLIKVISALPIYLLYKDKLKKPTDFESWNKGDEWQFGRDFLYKNNLPADYLLLLGRMPVMLLSLILGIYLFKFGKDLFGEKTSLILLSLYVFSPNIIAHSRLVTTDLGVTAFYFITVYYFYKLLKKPSKSNFLFLAISFSLAQLSKFSALILIPSLLIMLLIISIARRKIFYFKLSIRKIIIASAVLSLIVFLLIFAGYFFETGHILINNQNILTNYMDNKDAGKLILRHLATIKFPAYSYLSGLLKLYKHNQGGHHSYLLGHYSNFGWWYYFPVALLVKLPDATLLLLLATLATYLLFIFQKEKNLISLSLAKQLLFINIAPLVYFSFSILSNLNLGIRHVLVIFPFLFLNFGILTKINNKIIKKISLTFIYSAVVINAVIVFKIFPNYLSYFNFLSGGTKNGGHYLIDSNLDWGQDLIQLKKIMVKKDIPYVCISYFGQTDLNYYQIDYRYLLKNSEISQLGSYSCPVAISATSLFSQNSDYSWLKRFQPNMRIGGSIYVYNFINGKIKNFD